MISEKAHVDPSAKIGKNVTIHPFAFIDKNVEIGDNSVIMPFASIMNGTRIGSDCRVYQGAIIGADPQDFRWKGEDTLCQIGDRCVIREHVIINRSIHTDGATSVGDDTYICAETHIGHDCHIAGQSGMGTGVTCAGDVEV
ncbi:MAG: acyl-ACP--UDP-N-acetylglucosamine O-acyltransferase, partial [Muribaculaceae bacterium]|nr:acyl-ACP--UDP-N-acetylglucosamine O-acyltransferase [Muribaculaceae bacterium]